MEHPLLQRAMENRKPGARTRSYTVIWALKFLEEHSRKNCKLGTLYIAVTRYLIARTKSNENDNRWEDARRQRTFNLFLGGACAHGIPFKRLTSCGAPRNSHPTCQRLLNFYRGFQIIIESLFWWIR